MVRWGKGRAFVKTHDYLDIALDAYEGGLLLTLPMAFLGDVRVEREFENRGVGSMLVEEAIAECKRRGNEGIEGNISEVDAGHFDKLDHFYTKLGVSVVFYDREDPECSDLRRGKVELRF